MLDETDRSMIVQTARKRPADAATIKLKVNGKPQTVEVSPDTPLLWVLRETLGLTGTKFGCGMALCGACTVHLGGEAVRSCVTPISRAAGKDLTTIEGLKDEVGHALQAAWIAEDVPQCGYCQSGQIMSAAVLLRENPRPTDEDIDDSMTGNICRCGTYQRIRRAIHLAAQMKAGQAKQAGGQSMNDVVNLSRRRFLKSSALAGGGLVIGCYLPSVGKAAEEGAAVETTFAPNAFVRIGSDDFVTVMVNHSEMGQGTFTSLALLVAEELDADWSKVRAEHAPVDPAYNHVKFGMQMVGGSTSTWTEYDRLRKAGATARSMLVAAAADEWKVKPASCKVEKSEVVHVDSGKRLTFGKLAAAASRQAPPDDVKLKDPKTFRLIGKPTKRLDAPIKVDGEGVFGLDVNRPDMLVAVIARPPVFGGKAKKFDAKKAKAVPGVRDVIEISRGIAIVADGFWSAKKGRKALEVEWDLGKLASLDSSTQHDEYAKLAEKPGVVAKKEGDATAALAGAAKKLSAVYETPYLAHAPMEPQNCVADVRPNRCEVWTGSQFQTADRAMAAKIAGLEPEQVQFHTMLLGGGFGRRAVGDCHMVHEAVEVSKKLKQPVKVVWTREDDTRGGYYRPRTYHTIVGGLDATGKLSAWQHRIVCQSFIVGTPFEAFIVKNGVDETAVEGAADLPYAVPNLMVGWQMAPGGIPCLWWRSVGHSHNAFVVESFLDELAYAAGKDPFEFRRGLLEKSPRHKRVLELVAEKSGWGSKLPAGRARGIAVHESFGSFVAQVAEVSVSKEGKPRVHRVVCAIDCGPTVNPEGIRAQMESGIIFGLTAALFGEITFKDGRVQQSNFHNYPMLRMNEAPVVETHIVNTTDKMGGVGETGVPPIAPAVCNAIFALTGKRVRQLPIRPADIAEA